MVQTRNPGGEGGASDGSVHAAKLNTSDHTRATEPHQVVRDCLMASGASLAAGLTVTGHAPVLELCRRLVAVGHDPTTPMHVYRDATLALTVRSIGEAKQLVFPGEAGSFGADRVAEVLTQVGLPQLASRLEEEAHWNRMLSLGEQQRLGLARALLHAPNYLFLDEATASLDEPSEAALYKLLVDKLPATTIVSIGHRSTLDAFHQRNIALVRDGENFVLRDAAKVAAPS